MIFSCSRLARGVSRYAPALRPLRALARVFQVGRVTSARLADRLASVCRKEGLQAEQRALVALCELADNDIRSCLNTLQFLKSHHQNAAPGHEQALRAGSKRANSASASSSASIPRLTVDSIAALTVGSKDLGRDLFDVWKATFQTPKTKRTALHQHKPV